MFGLSQIQMIVGGALMAVIVALGVTCTIYHFKMDAAEAREEAANTKVRQLNDQMTITVDKNATLTEEVKQLTADKAAYEHSADIAHRALLAFQETSDAKLKGNQDAIDQGATTDDDRVSGALSALGRRLRGQPDRPAAAHRP